MGVCEPCCFARDGWLFLWGRRLMMVLGSGRSPGFTEPFFVLAHPSPVCKHVVWEFMLGACNRYFLHQGRAILARQGTAGSLHSFAVHCFPLSRTILQEMTSTLRQEIGRVLADAMQWWQDGQVFRTPTLESIRYDARAIAEGKMDVAEYNVDGQWMEYSIGLGGPTWVSMASHVDVAYDFVADDHDGYCSEVQYRTSRAPPRTGLLHVQVPLLRGAPLPEDPDEQEVMFQLPMLTRVPHHGVCGCSGYSLTFSRATVVSI